MNLWKYYNHAMVPMCPPNEKVDTTLIDSGEIWNENNKALLARYTTDFDCSKETDWWYVIKDSVFDINSVKAKRRYEINKGIKNFDVHVIDPSEYRQQIYEIQVSAFSVYPKKYRPSVNKEHFFKSIDDWGKYEVFGAFDRTTGELRGYALLMQSSVDYIEFCVQKTMPQFEKYGINAALVYGILYNYSDFLNGKGIISDGSRSIYHETHFQDYLEKYFGFRKAYCNLKIVYKPGFCILIKIIYCFRFILSFFDNIRVIHKVNAILKQEEFARKCNNE